MKFSYCLENRFKKLYSCYLHDDRVNSMLQAKKNSFFPDGDRTRFSHMLSKHYHVAMKAGLYRKAVQVCYIPIPCDSPPPNWASSPKSQAIEFIVEINPGNYCTGHRINSRFAPNVTGEEKFFLP